MTETENKDIKPIFEYLDEETLMVSSVLYLLVFGIPKHVLDGKSARKRLIRELAKTLAIFREMDKKQYLILVNISSTLIKSIPESMKLGDETDYKNIAVTPDKLLYYIKLKRPDIFNKLGVSDKTILSLEKVYGKSNHGFRSMMYVNRMLDGIKESLLPSVDRENIYQDILNKYNKER